MTDQVYGPERADRLVELLRSFAVRVLELDDQALLAHGPQLLRLIGDIRSELFHYEVRCTYDTPEAAERRRIVDEARRATDFTDTTDEDNGSWRDSAT
jgi:hypothetical protein